MDKHLLHILQHSLGLDDYGRGTGYRNHFCASLGKGGDSDACRELVALGYMQQHATTDMLPYYNCSVTDAGKEAIRRESPKPPALSRSKRRYLEFLNADSGMRFGEWLKTRGKVIA